MIKHLNTPSHDPFAQLGGVASGDWDGVSNYHEYPRKRN